MITEKYVKMIHPMFKNMLILTIKFLTQKSVPSEIVLTAAGPILSMRLPDRPFELTPLASRAAMFQSHLILGKLFIIRQT